MAYKMTLEITGMPKMDALSSSFSFSRSVDAKGRPSSGVYGGEIHISVESYKDVSILNQMLMKQHNAIKGKLTYDQGSNDGVMKTLNFTDAFITQYTESASAQGGEGMMISFTLSAREIEMGGAKLTNLWPDNKA